MDINKKLENISNKVSKVINDQKKVREENEKLSEENKKLKERILHLEKSVNELENKNLNLKIASTLKIDSTQKNEIISKIDNFLTEIDYCIRHLKS